MFRNEIPEPESPEHPAEELFVVDGLFVNDKIIKPNSCPICHEELGPASYVAEVCQKGAKKINKASVQRGDDVFVSAGEVVHEDCQDHYIDKKLIINLLRERGLNDRIQKQKTCPFCYKNLGDISDVVAVDQQGAEQINKASLLRDRDLVVSAGEIVHKECRKQYVSQNSIVSHLKEKGLNDRIEKQKNCPICHENLGDALVAEVDEKGAEGINKASLLREDDLVISAGEIVHKACRRRYSNQSAIERLLREKGLNDRIEKQKNCPICHENLGDALVAEVDEKGAEGINKASLLREDDLVISAGEIVHKACRRRYSNQSAIERLLREKGMSDRIKNQKTCPICNENLGDVSDVSEVNENGAKQINRASVQRGDNIVVSAESIVHKRCRSRYTNAHSIRNLLRERVLATLSDRITHQKTCPICYKDLGNANEVAEIHQRGADGINKASAQRGDDIVVSAGDILHIKCRNRCLNKLLKNLNLLREKDLPMSDHNINQKTCPICCDDLGNASNVNALRQSGADRINRASEQRGEDLVVSAGEKVHKDCRKWYIDPKMKRHRDEEESLQGDHSVSSGLFNSQTDCLFCGTTVILKHGNSYAYVKTATFMKNAFDHCNIRSDEWAMIVKTRIENLDCELQTAGCIYHKKCKINFLSGRLIPIQFKTDPVPKRKKSDQPICQVQDQDLTSGRLIPIQFKTDPVPKRKKSNQPICQVQDQDLTSLSLEDLPMSHHNINQKTCPICCDDLGNASNVNALRQSGADTINRASEQRGEDLVVSAGEKVHKDCRKWYIDPKMKRHRDEEESLQGDHSVSSGLFNSQTDCLFCGTTVILKHGNSYAYVKTATFMKNAFDHCNIRSDEWAMIVKTRIENLDCELQTAGCIYHKKCKINFLSGRLIPIQFKTDPVPKRKKSDQPICQVQDQDLTSLSLEGNAL